MRSVFASSRSTPLRSAAMRTTGTSPRRRNAYVSARRLGRSTHCRSSIATTTATSKRAHATRRASRDPRRRGRSPPQQRHRGGARSRAQHVARPAAPRAVPRRPKRAGRSAPRTRAPPPLRPDERRERGSRVRLLVDGRRPDCRLADPGLAGEHEAPGPRRSVGEKPVRLGDLPFPPDHAPILTDCGAAGKSWKSEPLCQDENR